MQMYRLVASDYDSALRQAHEQAGDGVRVVFRRDITKKQFLKTVHCCEITYYVAAPSPDRS